MKRSMMLVTLMIVLSGFAYAQDTLAPQSDDPCSRFAMRVVKPAENLDSKMVLQVEASADHPMVVNPCQPTSRLAQQAKPTSPESPQQQPSGAPSLKFRLPESRVKSPSEVLKQLAKPNPNRN